VAKEFNIIRNTFNFINTYVNKFPRPKRLNKEDKWILSRLNSLTERYIEYFSNYNGYKAIQEVMDFILNDLSRWYIKLVRDRTWPLYTGKAKNAAFYTLILVTENLVKLLSPICPFIAEDIYQNVYRKFKKGLASVHMYDLPKPNKRRINKKLEEEMEVIKTVVEASNAARQKINMKLRWPVKEVFVLTKDKKVKSAVKNLKEILLKSCNSKYVKVVTKEPKGDLISFEFGENKVFLNVSEDEEMYADRLYRELTRQVQSLRKKFNFVVNDRIKLTLKSSPDIEQILIKFTERIKKDVGADSVEIGKFEGKFEGELMFQDEKIKIKFDKS